MRLDLNSSAFAPGEILDVKPSDGNGTLRRNTKAIGNFSEIMVRAALARAGYFIAVPLGDNNRYDLIAEKDNKLLRVQVKTGRLRKGAILFACYSSHAHRKGPSCRPYVNEIDFFGVYCRELDSVYLVPIQDAVCLSGSLRVDRPRNGQLRKVRWASGYLIREPVSE